MSALSFLSEYRSDSEDSEYELETAPPKRAKLPVPNLNKVPVAPLLDQQYKDDPQLHCGRIRSFPHVRGNWATFVFVKYIEEHNLYDLLDKLQEQVLKKVESCQRCDDFHISVSKTVVLKYHLISAFSSSLQKSLKGINSFELGFSGVKVYCNEENSRTFISLEVAPFTEKTLLAITHQVDQVLTDFQLPTFYEDPSFHMSVLWVHGNKKSELNDIVESMNETLMKVSADSLNTTFVESINCKIGNRLFQYSLS